MELLPYLEINQNRGTGGDSAHQTLLNYITSNPEKLRAERYHFRYQEVQLVEEGEKLGVADLVFANLGERPFVVEAKVIRAGSPEAVKRVRNRINEQLRRARKFFLDKFNVLPITAGVYQFLGKREIHRYFLPPALEQIP